MVNKTRSVAPFQRDVFGGLDMRKKLIWQQAQIILNEVVNNKYDARHNMSDAEPVHLVNASGPRIADAGVDWPLQCQEKRLQI